MNLRRSPLLSTRAGSRFGKFVPVVLLFGVMLPAADTPCGRPGVEQECRVYKADGSAATLAEVVAAARGATVVFVGEEHDDATAHDLELELLKALDPSRLLLSLEMFERDVQPVLNEYLADLITEENFLASARAPRNYRSDYRPLIEYAKEHGRPVIAANAPRRYVNRVSRLGKGSLAALAESAKAFLAPLPVADASTEYAERFRRVMEEMRSASPTPPNPAHALEAQTLWDATMAFSIADALTRRPGSQVLHVNGRFHTERRLGILDHLARYRPNTSTLVVTIQSRKDGPGWDGASMKDAGDFVVVTRQKETPAPHR